MMAIQQQEYIDLKEYWDFQRKKEYNKERIFAMADKFEGRIFSELGPVSIDEMKQMLWTKIPMEEYEEPPKSWVPADEKYRLWNEEWPPKPQLEGPKGRPVILRAKVNKEDERV